MQYQSSVLGDTSLVLETLTTKDDALITDISKEFWKRLKFFDFTHLPIIGPPSYGGSYKSPSVFLSFCPSVSASLVFFCVMVDNWNT